jgi:hypothetical protein
MSDDFGLSSDDEADLLAVSEDVTNGKRSHGNHTMTDVSNKRAKLNGGEIPTISPSTKLANEILKSRFGLNGFRLEQEAAIARILDGGSAVVVFPTGGGKSLCYQVNIDGQSSGFFLTPAGACSVLSIPRRGIRTTCVPEQRCQPYYLTIDCSDEGSSRCLIVSWHQSGCSKLFSQP